MEKLTLKEIILVVAVMSLAVGSLTLVEFPEINFLTRVGLIVGIDIVAEIGYRY
jgi:hypothetical protein